MFKKLFARLTPTDDPTSSRFRHDMAEKICGYPVKYVTEKHGDNEDVIGRRGSINIKREIRRLLSFGYPRCGQQLRIYRRASAGISKRYSQR